MSGLAFGFEGHNSAVSGNSGVTVTLPASAAVGDVAIATITATSATNSADNAITAPAGWTLIGGQVDLGSPSVRLNQYSRVVGVGEPGTAYTFTTAANNNLGIIGSILTYSGVNTTTPVVSGESAYLAQATTTTARATSSITTSGTRWIVSCTSDKSNSTYTGTAGDTVRENLLVQSATTQYIQDSGADLAAGSYSRTLTGISTSVAVMGILALNPIFGAAASISLTGSSVAQAPGAALAEIDLAGAAQPPGTTAAGALSVVASAGVGAEAAASASLSISARQATPLDLWMAATPMYCAHRGGSVDWVEETADAYAHAAGWYSGLALEFSTWQCSTGEWVGSHDQTTGRMFGTNLDIPTTSWTTLSALRTTVGNFPMMLLSDFLTLYGTSRVLFIDNKGNQSSTAFYNLLDASGGAARIVSKSFYTNTSGAAAAHARGYKTWGYYYQADVPNLASTQANWDLLGMDYTADAPSWTAVTSYGKPVLGHIIPTLAGATTAFGKGASGVMVSGVMEAVPTDTATSGATLALAASGAAKAPDTALAALSLAVALTGVGAGMGAGTLNLFGSAITSAQTTRDINVTAVPLGRRFATTPIAH